MILWVNGGKTAIYPHSLTQYLRYCELSEAIGQFTELDTLLLQNVVKEIPESIGNLRNLDILSLTDNKELKTIPNSILNLENLAFLVLTGSGVELSSEMAEEFMVTADGVYARA